MTTKKSDDQTTVAFEIGSPLERNEPLEIPSPPRRKVIDHDKTPTVEPLVQPSKRAAELQAMLDDAEADIDRLRDAVEADIDAFTEAAISLPHEGDAPEEAEGCSEGPDDCTRCALEAAAKAARAALDGNPG